MAEHLALLQRTVDRVGGGKAVDYAAVEVAIAEGVSRTELAAHKAILKSLDMDVPAVVIGGVRYTRVGRCEGAYHTMVGSVSVERSLYRQSGQRGGQPGGRVVDAVSLRAGVVGGRVVAADRAGDELCRTARHVAGSGEDGARVETAAIFAYQFRAGHARGGRTGGSGSPRYRGRFDRCPGSAGGGILDECVARPGQCADGRTAAAARRAAPKGCG